MSKKKTPRWVEKYRDEYNVYADKYGKTAAAGLLKTFNPELLMMSTDTVARAFRAFAEEEDRGGVVGPTQCSVPPPTDATDLPPSVSDGIVIPYADGHVWCDCHIPLHNSDLIELSITRAAMRPGQNLYIAGDFMDMDWASKHQGWGLKGPRETRREFDMARDIMQMAMHVFKKIYVIPGNHDGTRFKYMSKGTLGFQSLMTLVLGSDEHMRNGSIVIGEQRHMTLLGSPYGDWRITHPDKARAVPLSLAQAISTTKHTNVIVAHQHFLGVAFDRYGKYIIADGGYMSSEMLMDYKTEVDSTHSAWAPGYLELVGGMPNIVSIPGQREKFGGFN